MSVLSILFTELLPRESPFPDSKISSICLRKSYVSRIKMFPFQPRILQISAKMLFIQPNGQLLPSIGSVVEVVTKRLTGGSWPVSVVCVHK